MCIIIVVKCTLNSWVYFAHIMPVFCSLLFASYYSKNFGGKIRSSLVGGELYQNALKILKSFDCFAGPWDIHIICYNSAIE